MTSAWKKNGADSLLCLFRRLWQTESETPGSEAGREHLRRLDSDTLPHVWLSLPLGAGESTRIHHRRIWTWERRCELECLMYNHSHHHWQRWWRALSERLPGSGCRSNVESNEKLWYCFVANISFKKFLNPCLLPVDKTQARYWPRGNDWTL